MTMRVAESDEKQRGQIGNLPHQAHEALDAKMDHQWIFSRV